MLPELKKSLQYSTYNHLVDLQRPYACAIGDE
jgi:hypothetical protein